VRPDVPAVLEAIAALLDAQSDPQARSAYDADALLRAASLLRAVAEAFDGAVAWRVAELQAWRALFAQAAPAVADRALSAALATAAAAPTPAGASGDAAQAPIEAPRAPTAIDALPAEALRVSALDARLDALRELAGELLAWTETADTPVAEAIGHAVWDALRASTERRRVAGARF
jgi:hypothetical protein